MIGDVARQTDQNRAFARQLAADSIASGDNVGWFEKLYAAAETGAATVPWADFTPNPNLVTALADLSGLPYPAGLPDLHMAPARERALVVGCGYGDDAEYVASLGFDTVAFDVAPSAITGALRNHPQSTVEYVTADLLAPPDSWVDRFDLVVEVYTIQVLTGDARRRAIEQLSRLVAPGGRLLVIARARDESDPPGQMPWPLTRADIEAFQVYGLSPVSIVDFMDPQEPEVRRWKAWYAKDAKVSGQQEG
jgi:SAM-dependent methyltransferase